MTTSEILLAVLLTAVVIPIIFYWAQRPFRGVSISLVTLESGLCPDCGSPVKNLRSGGFCQDMECSDCKAQFSVGPVSTERLPPKDTDETQ